MPYDHDGVYYSRNEILRDEGELQDERCSAGTHDYNPSGYCRNCEHHNAEQAMIVRASREWVPLHGSNIIRSRHALPPVDMFDIKVTTADGAAHQFSTWDDFPPDTLVGVPFASAYAEHVARFSSD